jgi:integrase
MDVPAVDKVRLDNAINGVVCPLTLVHGAWIEFSSLVGGVGVRLFWLNFTFHDLRHEAISRMFKIY